MNVIKASSSSLNLRITHILVAFLLMQGAVFPAPPQKNKSDFGGTLAYIRAFEGRDAVFVKDATSENVIFTCDDENEIILTPAISRDGKHISFVVDDGRNHKTVHLLGPIEKHQDKWQADDSIIIVIRGGAWPLYAGNQNFFLAMPDQASLEMQTTTHIFQIKEEEILQVSDTRGISNHIRPLLNPEADRIVYREISIDDTTDWGAPAVRSIIQELETGATSSHFENQEVFLEQWIANGEILFSYKMNDREGNRVYSLYDPVSGGKREIYTNVSRQGSLTSDLRYLATIRQIPAGGAQYDIIVADLVEKTEQNLTQTKQLSESLIGWLK